MARVLVLDDNPLNRELVAAVLAHRGDAVLQAADGAEGLELCRAQRPELVISDILMPTMDGYEFVRQLRGSPELAQTRVIFYTAHYHEREARQLAEACGVSRVLVKPCEPEEILRVVNAVLAGAAAPARAAVPEDFDREHLRLMTDKLAKNAEALSAANASLAALIDLNLQLASERSPQALLERVCRGARELIGAKYGFITVKDKHTRQELLSFTSGIEPSLLEGRTPLRIDTGPLQRILAEERACRFSNPGGDPRAVGLPEQFPSAHSVLAAPIVSLSFTYGWLCLVDKLGAAGFHAEDQRLLSILAAQVGRIYENGSLYVQVQRHAEQLLLEMAERERAAAELRESERRFSDMLRNVRMISLMLDREARITYCNDHLLQISGWAREEILDRDWFEVFAPPEGRTQRPFFGALLEGSAEAWHQESEIVTKPGARRLIRWHNTVLRSAGGDIVGVASLGEDITEQAEQQQRIARLTRIYAVLSGINSAIVRIHDRRALLAEACRIAAVEGAFRMAWIVAFDDEAQAAQIWACAGASDASLEALGPGTAEGARVARFGQRAVKETRPILANDLGRDGDIAPHAAALLAHGIRAVAAFPLFVDRHPVAALMLFAGEAGLFDEQELRLLNELAGDISFGLQYIAKDEQLTYLAYYDALTGLANRTLFHERLRQYAAEAGRTAQMFALVFADADRLDTINETFGRHCGDELLRQIAQRMLEHAGTAHEVARMGPHHFAAVVQDVEAEGDVARAVEQWLRKVFDEPFDVDGHEISMAARAGVALFPSDGMDPDSLLKNAEAALRKAKASGERHLLYTPHLTEQLTERLSLEHRLRRAIENEELVLHYQPKVDLESRRLLGLEALMRWRSPELGLVPPTKFIPLMEETGMIVEAGLWALRQAALDRSLWLEKRLTAPRVAVNVSPVQVRRKDFIRSVEQVLRLAGTEPGLDVEVTESLILDDIEENIAKLHALRALGIGIALDDFGTGYSSLGYLARLPVSTLKIDRSFTRAMLDDPSAITLISTIVTLAHSMKLTVVVEGVESEEQAKFLRLLRCDQMQGYLISKPLPFEEMMAYLARSPRGP